MAELHIIIRDPTNMQIVEYAKAVYTQDEIVEQLTRRLAYLIYVNVPRGSADENWAAAHHCVSNEWGSMYWGEYVEKFLDALEERMEQDREGVIENFNSLVAYFFGDIIERRFDEHLRDCEHH